MLSKKTGLMPMKRIYLAAGLLLIVVAVAYIKSARGTSQSLEAFEQGKKQASQELAKFQQDVDSLKELLRLQEESFGDSLAQRDGLYRQEISRLVGYLDSTVARPKPKTVTEQPTPKKQESKQKQEIVEQAIEEKPIATQSKDKPVEIQSDEKPTATESEDKSVEPEKNETEPIEITKLGDIDEIDSELSENVLTFYGKLYDGLPKDLTSQERKVALYEISIKTAAEYSISMPELKAICENYYLSY